MTLADSSSLKVPYDLRPAKQAERRMFLDLLLTLSTLGFQFPEYHYVGFGSIFFFDHRLFHKELRFSKMTSVEGFAAIYKRCKFNQPFSHIKLYKGLSSQYIPSIDKDESYFIWFDYDFCINKLICEDAMGASSLLKPGSILVITMDTHLPDEAELLGVRKLRDYFQKKTPNYAHASLKPTDFAADRRVITFVEMLSRSINRGISTRTGISFEPLINITYADGHKMVTVGGMIADQQIRNTLKNSILDGLPFLRRKLTEPPFHIPRFIFTKRELLSMEASCPDGAVDVATGITRREFKEFLPFYRYWPTYSEILL